MQLGPMGKFLLGQLCLPAGYLEPASEIYEKGASFHPHRVWKTPRNRHKLNAI